MNKTTSSHLWLVYGTLFVASVLFIYCFSTTTSPLYKHCQFWFFGDSGIFKEMGLCLLQGKTPYVDLFDHKGPVLWFIQALGIWINPNWGLMTLQSLSLFCALVIFYKTVFLLLKKQFLSLIITIFGLLFLIAVYEQGNLCEEWSLPFITIPIYLYIKRLISYKNIESPGYCLIDSFITGLCVGVLAMIRLNNTAPIIGFVVWYYIKCLKYKEYRRLWNDIAMICGGMATVIVLCSIFYFIKAGWNGIFEMLYGTFFFNYNYYKFGDTPDSLFLRNYIIPLVFFSITLVCFINKKINKSINAPLTISYIITFLAIGSFGFGHYMMLFIPLYILSISQIVQTEIKWCYLLPFILLLYSVRLSYTSADLLLFRLRGKQSNTELIDGFHQFVTSITPEERLSIYKEELSYMGTTLFANENICQCNRFIYRNHIRISPRFQMYAKTHGIKDLQPIWVLTQGPRPEATDEYMHTHYTLADSIPAGEYEPIWCWKRNDLLSK